MKQEVKTAPMARESSFINLLSGWMQQGVENFFATQRILVDLAMRQNGSTIDVMREKLTAPDFQPVAVAKEFAGEGLANFIEGQKLLLGLAQREGEILATGVKERIGGYAVTDALISTIHRSMNSTTATHWSSWPAAAWRISCRPRRSSCMWWLKRRRG